MCSQLCIKDKLGTYIKNGQNHNVGGYTAIGYIIFHMYWSKPVSGSDLKQFLARFLFALPDGCSGEPIKTLWTVKLEL